jgi:hypothetical protein
MVKDGVANMAITNATAGSWTMQANLDFGMRALDVAHRQGDDCATYRGQTCKNNAATQAGGAASDAFERNRAIEPVLGERTDCCSGNRHLLAGASDLS